MRTPLQLEQGPLDLDHKPTSDEYLDLTHRGSRVPLDEVRQYPGGRVFEPVRPTCVEPAREAARAARMNVAPPAVIAQLRAIRAQTDGDDRFTHRLISRRMLEVYNSTGDRLPGLRRRYAYNPAFMHPADLDRLGVRPGDVVRIDSDHDFIYAVAEATSDVRPGVVSIAHARGDAAELDGKVRTIGSSTARLVSVERDFEPISGIPRQSAIPVNVRALDAAERATIAAGESAVVD